MDTTICSMALKKAKLATVALLAWALVTTRAESPTVPPDQARMDRYGDPPPAGALARLGTLHYRTGGRPYCLAFAPRGRVIAVAAQGQR